MSKRSFITTGKKVLASAVSAAMVVAFAPVVAWGGEEVNRIAITENSHTLTSGYYYLPGDVTLTAFQNPNPKEYASQEYSGQLEIPEDAEVTIDLCGNTLISTYEGISILNRGKLTIVDSSATSSSAGTGLIYNNNTEPISWFGHDIIRNLSTGSLFIKGGRLGDKDSDDTNTNEDVSFGAAIRNLGEATIDGGAFTCVDNYYYYANPYSGGPPKMYSYAIRNSGSMTINGGKIYGSMNGGISADGGTITINDVVVNVFGTYSYACLATSANAGKIVVHGGTFNKTGNNNPFLNSFSGMPSWDASNSLETNGYIVDGGTFVFNGVEKKLVPVAKAGDKSYPTLEEAIAAAGNVEGGCIVDLLKDVEVSAQVNLPAGVTINGNSHAIKAADEFSGGDLVLLNADNAGLKNVVLDCNGKANQVQAYVAEGITLENITVNGAKKVGLNINASTATLKGEISLTKNGWGNYINLSWGRSIDPKVAPKKCSLTVDATVMGNLPRVWTDMNDINRANDIAEGTADQWAGDTAYSDKFAVIVAEGAAYEPYAQYIQDAENPTDESKNGVSMQFANVCSIDYVLNGGTLPEGTALTYVEGKGLPTLPTPTRSGYSFAGWYDNSSFNGDSVYSIADTATGEKTFYAKWVERTTSGGGSTGSGTVTPPAPSTPEVGDTTSGVEIPSTPGESGTSGTTTVDITVTDTTATTDSKGNKVDGTVSIDKIESSESSVSIPETITTKEGTFLVTSIPAEAMKDNTTVESVTIPESVTSIGESAFAGCTELTSVTVPAGVTEIKDSTFAGCTNLETVEVQGEVTSIAPSAFEDCTSLTSINVPDTVTTIGESAFAGCTSLTSVTVPASVATIEANTFANCTSLETVEVKGELTEIAADAFNGCANLTSMTVAGTVKPMAIGTRAAAKALVIPASVTKVGNRAFKGTGITSVTIPAGVKMGAGVFRDCKQLTKAAVAKGVKTLSSYTFKGCSALKSVSIPSTVTKVERSAFSGCKNLAKVTLPKSVTSIGKNALYGASKAKTLTVNSKQLTKKGVKDSLKGSSVTTVYVPKSKVAAYKKIFTKSNCGKTVKVRAI